jgi:hypothetical protein
MAPSHLQSSPRRWRMRRHGSPRPENDCIHRSAQLVHSLPFLKCVTEAGFHTVVRR